MKKGIDFFDLKNLLISLIASFTFWVLQNSIEIISPKIKKIYLDIKNQLLLVFSFIFVIFFSYSYLNKLNARLNLSVLLFLFFIILILQFPSSQLGKSIRIKNSDLTSITRIFKVNKIKYINPNEKVQLTWKTFGIAIEDIKKNFEGYSPNPSPDIFFGVNEAGLVIATFIAGSLGRSPIGYIKTGGRDAKGNIIIREQESFFPKLKNEIKSIALFDFEIKSGSTFIKIQSTLKKKYNNKVKIFYVVLGASSNKKKLNVEDVKEISANINDNDKPKFFRFIMHNTGIEPPLGLH